jgi:hypothetical protein
VTVCRFQTSSEHSTSLGRVRYQRCICGRYRVLLDSDVLAEVPSAALHANRIPATRRWEVAVSEADSRLPRLDRLKCTDRNR